MYIIYIYIYIYFFFFFVKNPDKIINHIKLIIILKSKLITVYIHILLINIYIYNYYLHF
jgi:hypothetical protein